MGCTSLLVHFLPTHRWTPGSGPPGIRLSLAQPAPARKISCRTAAQTLGPEDTGPLCPGSRGACCHRVEIQVLIFLS